MRKIPPVPEPPGQAYCFICQQLLPESDFTLRAGKLSRPCRSCKRTASERNAPVRTIIAEAVARMDQPRPVRPETEQIDTALSPNHRFLRWYAQQQEKARKAARKAARGAPKDSPCT